jgi:hypothetical protein
MLTWCDRNYPKVNSDSNKRLQIWHCDLVWSFWQILNSYFKFLMPWPISACIIILFKNIHKKGWKVAFHEFTSLVNFVNIQKSMKFFFFSISMDKVIVPAPSTVYVVEWAFLGLHCSKHLKIQFWLHLAKTSLIRLTKTLWNGTFICTYF